MKETMMRLSEAIRLGAMLGPQCYGVFFDLRGGSCANGAAFNAVGVNNEMLMERRYIYTKTFMGKYFPIAVEPTVPPIPISTSHRRRRKDGSIRLCHVIAILNNEYRWTRERIADWVESIERERGLWPAPAESEAHEFAARG